MNYDTAGENGKEEQSARNYISPSSAHHRDQVAFVILSNIKKHIISFNVFEYDITQLSDTLLKKHIISFNVFEYGKTQLPDISPSVLTSEIKLRL